MAPRSDKRAAKEMSPSPIESSRIVRDDTAPVRSSDGPTALCLICADPTLSRGSSVAAYALPPSATKTATVDMTFA